MELIEAIDIVTDASILDVLKSIRSEYGDDERDVIADNLAWLAVMLKHGGDLVEMPFM
jgi:hypothetical protein